MNDQALSAVPLGQRVTVRRLDEGRPTDTVGIVTGRDEDSVILETRQGPVRVVLSTVQVFRLVTPAPWRIANFLRRGEIAVLGLDAVLGAGGPVQETIELIDELLAADTPVFVFAEEGPQAVSELEEAGLGHLSTLILSPDADQPGTDVLALAHARLQDQMGATVAVRDVHYSAADPHAVEAARQLGWQARIFTLPT